MTYVATYPRTVVITPPEPIVALSTAKAHCRVDHNDDDALIQAYVEAACGWIDGPSGWLGRSLGVQTLETRLDEFPCASETLLPLPYGPLIDIVSVKYDDAEGVEQTWSDVDAYSLDPAGLQLDHGVAWPAARLYRNAVRVRYRAGFVLDPAATPLVARVDGGIIAAVLMMIGHLYANREAVSPGAPVVMPMGVEALLSTHRVWTL